MSSAQLDTIYRFEDLSDRASDQHVAKIRPHDVALLVPKRLRGNAHLPVLLACSQAYAAASASPVLDL
jgi:hypothetical protein